MPFQSLIRSARNASNRTAAYRQTAAAVIVLLAVCGIGWVANRQTADPRNLKTDIALAPNLVLGTETCAKCHAAEINVWKQTPHHETFMTLHRKPQAQVIATKMGITSFKHDSACIKCHYSMQEQPGGLEPIAGISCESCHGAARKWIDVHHDYGGPGIKRDQESTEHRQGRLIASIEAGMRNPENVYLVAQSCYRCHTVPDEKLVNVGGHVPGSLDFELVAWSQGKVRHNFVRSDGKSNLPSSPQRLRMMFMAGMIADLEFSLRATAEATVKETYGTTAAGRAARAAKRIAAAQEKLQQPVLDEVLATFKSVQLKLNNRQQLLQAADTVAALGTRFAATVSGDALAAMDPYLPKPDQWK